MQLQIGRYIREIQQRLGALNGVDIGAAARHGFAQHACAIAVRAFQCGGGQLAQQGQRAEVGLAVPGAFLAAQCQNAQWRSLFVAAAQLKQHQHAGDNACQSVEVAALRHGIGMRANDDVGFRPGLLWQAQPQVAGSIPFMTQAQVFGPVLKYAQRGRLAFAIAFTGDAQAVTGGFANLREQGLRQCAGIRHGVAGHHAPLPPCRMDQSTGEAEKSASVAFCSALSCPLASSASCS